MAAATFRRSFLAVELGNGQRFVGSSDTGTLPTATQLVTSLSVKLAGATDANAKLCASGTLDPAKAAGKVVQCDRGVVDRIEKSFEVQRVGGVGMVMTNTSANSLNGDLHPIPSTHVSHEARQPILDYIAGAGAGATARIVPLTAAELGPRRRCRRSRRSPRGARRSPLTATCSSPTSPPPGVDVLAAVAPPFHFGRDWDMISGTSMASPHIAGPVADADTKHYQVTVAAGTLAARFSLDSANDMADLDLFVYQDGEFVDLSASGAADEQVTLLKPEEGTYDVYVNGFATPGGSTSYGLANFVVGPGDLANSDIAPASAMVAIGEETTFTASWTGLDTAQRWLGVISYSGVTNGSPVTSDAMTILSVG